MIRLFAEATDQENGTITAAQFRSMQDQLEEEGPDDDDYYVNRATIDLFRERGADAALVMILEQALGDREDMDVRFTQD